MLIHYAWLRNWSDYSLSLRCRYKDLGCLAVEDYLQ